jgi:hypothetical protein
MSVKYLQVLLTIFSMGKIMLLRKIRTDRVAQVVEHLPSKYYALSSNPSTKKNQKQKHHIWAEAQCINIKV